MHSIALLGKTILWCHKFTLVVVISVLVWYMYSAVSMRATALDKYRIDWWISSYHMFFYGCPATSMIKEFHSIPLLSSKPLAKTIRKALILNCPAGLLWQCANVISHPVCFQVSNSICENADITLWILLQKYYPFFSHHVKLRISYSPLAAIYI